MAKTDWSSPRAKPKSSNEKLKTAPRRDWSRQQDNLKRPPRLSPAERRAQKEQQHELNELLKQEQLTAQRIAERRKREKKKSQEQQTREVFIPQIVNVTNLSRILGIRLGKQEGEQIHFHGKYQSNMMLLTPTNIYHIATITTPRTHRADYADPRNGKHLA